MRRFSDVTNYFVRLSITLGVSTCLRKDITCHVQCMVMREVPVEPGWWKEGSHDHVGEAVLDG